ncbi:AAA family ATPase [Dolosicoccus paucivorans]|uniref:AAA family ATPase n=1 Tax=Dolosicoccus paucivorans TaxID=84521 RepID=UPI00088C5149|nr:AAA family ATPase [Dolosicoccus paucivorans]SDI40445.1 phage nucleotide-binding protein [Dolosicoccus paucivorans]
MKIISAKDIDNNASTYIIYANPGVGKTSSIKHIPGKTLLIDIDKSSSVLAGSENIDVLSVDTYKIWESWMDLVTWLHEPKNIKDYDNIVIDNVTELFRSILTQLGREGKNNRVPGMDAYQRTDFVIMDSFRALQRLHKRLIFTAWETSDLWTKPDGQTVNRAMPDIRKPILNNFLGLADVVGRLIVTRDEEEKERRGFILQPREDIYAKNRLDDRKGCKVEELIV